MEKLRACIVGIGFVGGAHIEALRRIGNVEISAVCTRENAQQTADAYGIPRGYEDKQHR